MKTKVIVLGLIAILAAIPFAYFSGAAAQEGDVVECAAAFKAAVRQGPTEGLAVAGEIQLTVDATGAAEGALVLEDGSEIPAFGQVQGRAISLIFDLGEDRYIYGVGTALNDIATSEACGTVLGGPFAGPEEGDSGDWVAGLPAEADAE